MKKILLLTALIITGCTIYTEKQTESVSQNAYAVNDSLSKERVDLTWFYSNELCKFIKPPKHPISLDSVYITNKVVKDGKTVETKSRVIIVPKCYGNDKVVVVGSAEYQDLLKDSALKKQFERDNFVMSRQIDSDNKELTKQKDMQDKMVKDLNHLQSEIYKKDRGIWIRNFVILGLSTVIGGYIYLRASRFLLF
jgi:hypothetical protein